MIAILELLAGWLLLWKGGDALVDGADRLGKSLGMPATLAGVFILGFGTSAPELATSVLATIQGKPAIALGNVIGSNIANVALILGATAAIAAVPVNRFLQWVEIPFCLVASGVAWYLAANDGVGFWDGVILLGLFGVYGLTAFWTFSHREELKEEAHEEIEKHYARDALVTSIGLGAVIGGAYFFVEGASTVAGWLGVTDGVIGLTLVALGTSLPELATGIAAVRAGKPDLLLGNIIGSNIFNILMVLGVAAMMQEQQPEARMIEFDFPVMIGLACAVFFFGFFHRIPRWVGAAFLLIYFVYVFVFSAAAA